MKNQPQPFTWTNWVGNQSFSPNRVIEVLEVTALQEEVAEAAAKGLKVRTYGAGHSFTPLIETKDVLINMEKRLFPRYNDFVEMRRRFDPKGTFLNAHTSALFA